MNIEETRKLRLSNEELAKLQLAYENGADIEQWSYTTGRWVSCQKIGPDWERSVKYRVKPVPKLRPYNPEEMKTLVGKVLIKKSSGVPYLVTSGVETYPDLVMIANTGERGSVWILGNYTYPDGSSCGVME